MKVQYLNYNNGEDKYFINRNGLLTDYSTTNPLTLTGSLGTITTDGICNATVTKDGNTIDTTYSMDGESLTIIIDGKKHTLKVDTATNTYQELNSLLVYISVEKFLPRILTIRWN